MDTQCGWSLDCVLQTVGQERDRVWAIQTTGNIPSKNRVDLVPQLLAFLAWDDRLNSSNLRSLLGSELNRVESDRWARRHLEVEKWGVSRFIAIQLAAAAWMACQQPAAAFENCQSEVCNPSMEVCILSTEVSTNISVLLPPLSKLL